MVQLVQAVEYAEYVDACISSLVDEVTDNIFRIVRISDRVGAACQHLEENVRSCFSHLAQSVPRAFIEETVSYVECSAAPVFKGEKLRYMDSGVMDGVHDIMRSYAGSEQRLVRISVGGIHEHDFLAVHDPFSEFFRSQFIKELAGALRCLMASTCCFMRSIERRNRSEVRFVLMACACIAIDRDIADIGQKSCASVGNGIRFLQQPWVSVDVVDVAETFLEIAGTEHILQEVNICLDA